MPHCVFPESRYFMPRPDGASVSCSGLIPSPARVDVRGVMDIDLARSTSARSWTNVVARGPIDGRARHMSGRDCGWPSLWRPTIPAAIMTRMDTVKTHTVSANGIRQQVHMGGPEDGQPVLLVHGNCSSADFWQPL